MTLTDLLVGALCRLWQTNHQTAVGELSGGGVHHALRGLVQKRLARLRPTRLRRCAVTSKI